MNDPRFGSQGTGRQTRGGLTSLGKGDSRKRAIRKKLKMFLMGVAMGSTHIPTQPVSASSQHNNHHQRICKSNTRSKRGNNKNKQPTIIYRMSIYKITSTVNSPSPYGYRTATACLKNGPTPKKYPHDPGRKSLDESMPDEMCHLVTYFRMVLISKGNMFKAINQTLELKAKKRLIASRVAELASQCTTREPFQRPEQIWRLEGQN
ncbi:Concanavalin A-like lectin/glucanase, subgroup [Artemisia annua]|uniref:Concanavalin A-like lectin/glucanase, subgroup n=1 Tax=Artemisia annua TaxID=35608 RepID=A0A2U1P663_ARTAN|nr:Concanavalin A-like lectin/glucanase, subgroup [Artemisia annua]